VSPETVVVRHGSRLDALGAMDVLADYDLVLDGADNFATRYLVGDACARLGIPMVYASAFLPGATAPASVAGCVVLANAEMLSGPLTVRRYPVAPSISANNLFCTSSVEMNSGATKKRPTPMATMAARPQNARRNFPSKGRSPNG